MSRLIAPALALVGLAFVLSATTGCSSRASKQQTATWNAEIARLQGEQDSLRARAAELVKADPRIQALPQGDVVLSIPTSFVRNVIQRVFEEVASSVTLQLSGIKAHVEKSVKKIVTIGNFVVDISVDEVIGKIRPQKPDIGFDGGRISLRLPVQVHEGTGKATIHFVWDGKHVADLTCGDMDITQKVSGNVVPARYVVSGTLDLAMKDNRIVGTPHLPVTKVNIKVTPSKDSWKAIEAILEEKRGACGYVLDKVDVKSILRNVVQGKGFNVTLPFHKVRPFTVPAGVSDSVSVQGRLVAVEATSNMIRIDPDVILYGADVTLK